MKSIWDRRIARAEELAKTCAAAAELLTLYARLAAFQKEIFEALTAHPETDPLCIVRYFPRLLALVKHNGPKAVGDYARESLSVDAEVGRLLIAHWNHEPVGDDCARFVARALLQPFAEALAGRGDITGDSSSGVCPFCGARPLAAVLRGEGDGGKRYLVCSLCGIEWELRRILCPNCAEENKDKLPVYVAPEFVYVRVEACDTCQTYLKCIDMTTNGLAVAPADELASVTLNVWAEEHGYSKIEPNLLGL
jgi:FdhE protein